jgi:hypothetical protein
MCFSKEVSLGTFIIGAIGSALLYSLNTKIDKILAIFFFYAILMQLLEYILWNNLTCNLTNKITTFMAIILNQTQPVILALLLMYNYKLTNTPYIIIFTIIYLLLMIIYDLQTNTLCTLKNNSNHLEWGWHFLNFYYLVYSIYILYLSYIILSIPYNWNNKLLLFIIIPYLISHYIYLGSGAIGSMWCFFAAFFPILWYIFRKLKYIK